MREETRNAFCAYMLEELSALAENVIQKYEQNAEGRRRNPFLSFANPSAEKFMGLGRSIDSQLGNRIQNIVFYLARIRYGASAVPNIINICIDETNQQAHIDTYYVTGAFSKLYYYAGTNPCQQKIYINGTIDDTKARHLLRLKKTAPDVMRTAHHVFALNDADIHTLRSLTISQCPVDLCIIENINDILHVNTFEIKLSGNLDTKNAESNADEVERLKKIFLFTGNNQSYFASCYGECSAAVRAKITRKDILTNTSILSGSSFWNLILPVGEEELSYADFITLYSQAFRESELENRIIAL